MGRSHGAPNIRITLHDRIGEKIGISFPKKSLQLLPAAGEIRQTLEVFIGLCRGNSGEVVGTILGNRSIDALRGSGQGDARKVMAMGTRPKWVGILVMLAVLLCISTLPGYADRGRHGYKGHAYKSHGHRGHWHRGHGFHHGFRGPRVRVGIGLGTFWGPSWGGGPYWPHDAYAPVVVAPPLVVVQPSPHYWYYCDASQAYYPYVPQCPGGWRRVLPTPLP
jgi:hypothetical protein